MNSSPDTIHSDTDGQALLLEITQRIARGGSLSAILPDVTRAAQRSVAAEGIRVVISNSLAYATGSLAGKMLKFDPLIARIVSSKGMVEVADVAAEKGELTQLTGSLSALLALPLNAQQTYQGMLWIGYEQPHNFTAAERMFLAIVAAQTAVAIANAQAFDAARRGREQLAAILTSSADPILVINAQNELVLLNPAAERVFGVNAESTIGKPVGAVIDATPLVTLLTGASGNSEGVEWQNAAGQTFAPRVSDICDDDQDRTGRVLVLRDITRYKNLQQTQSEFVSTISHDLRSPLTYMQGYASMIPMVGPMNDKQRGFDEKIIAGVLQMADLVDKILDAGRLDPDGNFALSREACDVTKMVSDVVNTHIQPAEKKGLTLKAEVDPYLPILNLDDFMLRRGLNNLVDNAVKYTPEGGAVTVKATIHDDNLWLQVQDTGLGISPENQKILFERFKRVRRREHTGVKGSGLGLFIVKGIAQRHGGDATVASEEGQGSTFTIRIPLAGPNLVGGDTAKA